MRWLYGTTLLVIVIALVIGLCHVYKAVNRAILSERDYGAGLFALELVGDYVAEHGAWPRSWHDLEHIRPHEQSKWPGGLQSIQERVAIDFDVDLNEVAKQSVSEFIAIRTIEPNALFEDETLRRAHIGALLEKVRQAKEGREKLNRGIESEVPPEVRSPPKSQESRETFQ